MTNSPNLMLGLVWLAPGAFYPAHAHHFTELYQVGGGGRLETSADCCVQVVSGTGQWGPNPAWLESKQPGDLIYHAPAQPHCIQGNHYMYRCRLTV